MTKQDKLRPSHLARMLSIEDRSPPGKPGGDPLPSPVLSPRIAEIADQARYGPKRLSMRRRDARSMLSAEEPPKRSRPSPSDLLTAGRSTHYFFRYNSANFSPEWPYAPDSNRCLLTQVPPKTCVENRGMRIGSPRPPTQYKATYLPFQT